MKQRPPHAFPAAAGAVAHPEPTKDTENLDTGPLRWGLLVMALLLAPSCAMRPASMRNVNIIDPQTDAVSEQPAAANVRRRPAEEFEQLEFTVADNQSVIGTLLSMRIGPGETLSDVARHFGLGYEEIAQANPNIDPWVPAANSEVLIPQLFVLPRSARRGIVINLAAMRLFRFKVDEGGMQVTTYPVGIGREGKSTPMGAMAIARKTKHPAWYPTKNILADHARRGDPLPAMVPPGPDNPLGDYAMYLTRPSYLIHGTNKPFSVGLRASNGCIRMYPENIEPLFGATALREPVQIVNQPYVYGWRGDVLYLQAYPPHEELNPGALRAAIEADLRSLQDSKNHSLDWDRVAQVLREERGVPIPISQGSPGIEGFLASAVPVTHPGVLFGRPTLPTDDLGGWRVFATDTASEITARRVAAVLNHQGPPIPAKAIEVGERYQVIAGPFADPKAAKIAAHRMRADLELEPRVLAPDEQIAGTEVPAATRAVPVASNRVGSTTRSGADATGGLTSERHESSLPVHDESVLTGREAREPTVGGAAFSDQAPAVHHDAQPVTEAIQPGAPTEPVWTEVAPRQELPAGPAEPVWTEVTPATPSVPTDATEPALPATAPAGEPSLPATPDPYDAAAWPTAAEHRAPPEAEEANVNDDAQVREKDGEQDDNSLELVPLEYPPPMYLPDNSADPIRFIEPGLP